jgi:hypothetical protein
LPSGGSAEDGCLPRVTTESARREVPRNGAEATCVGFIRDRRRYGELRLPVDRRSHQRVSWLDNDLRTRRAHLLRPRAKELAVLITAVTASAAAFV